MPGQRHENACKGYKGRMFHSLAMKTQGGGQGALKPTNRRCDFVPRWARY